VAGSHSSVERERQVVQAMMEHRVDGVILCAPPFRPEHGRRLQDGGLPLVVVNNQAAGAYPFSVEHDDLSGARTVARCLLACGLRRLAYLGNAGAGQTNANRLDGVCAELKSAGMTLEAGMVFHAPSGRPEDGYAGARFFLGQAERPQAVMCFNDLLAVGLMRGLQEAGLRVPADCAVTGFDNIDLASYLNPPLTTFDQPRYQLGVEAARLLLRRLDDPAALPTRISLAGHLVLRQSTPGG
jgi:LacI family transcriptional regulator